MNYPLPRLTNNWQLTTSFTDCKDVENDEKANEVLRVRTEAQHCGDEWWGVFDFVGYVILSSSVDGRSFPISSVFKVWMDKNQLQLLLLPYFCGDGGVRVMIRSVAFLSLEKQKLTKYIIINKILDQEMYTGSGYSR